MKIKFLMISDCFVVCHVMVVHLDSMSASCDLSSIISLLKRSCLDIWCVVWWCGVVWCGETINSCIVRTGTATPCVLPRSVVHSTAGEREREDSLS